MENAGKLTAGVEGEDAPKRFELTEDVSDLLLEKTRRKIFLWCCRTVMTPPLLADKLGKRLGAIHRHLEILVEFGLVEKLAPRASSFDKTKQSRNVRYKATEFGQFIARKIGEGETVNAA